MLFKATFLEFVIRGIPEGLLFVLAAYTFSKAQIDIKRYLTSSALFAIIIYLVRLLPIQLGAITILNIIVLICLIVFINKIDTLKAIKSGIIIMILGFVCEGINVFIIQFILKKDMEEIFRNATLKVLYGMPSVLIFGCIVILFYLKQIRTRK